MDIGIAKKLTALELSGILTLLFQGAVVAVVDHYEEIGVDADVLVVRSESNSEFPTGIALHANVAPEDDYGRWLIEVARQLSAILGVRTICDGSLYGDDESPYWSLLWESGQAMLADDCDTAYSGDGLKPVRIVRPLHVESHQLGKFCLSIKRAGVS